MHATKIQAHRKNLVNKKYHALMLFSFVYFLLYGVMPPHSLASTSIICIWIQLCTLSSAIKAHGKKPGNFLDSLVGEGGGALTRLREDGEEEKKQIEYKEKEEMEKNRKDEVNEVTFFTNMHIIARISLRG